jgi:DNA-binding MarR family transcriptional regulator
MTPFNFLKRRSGMTADVLILRFLGENPKRWYTRKEICDATGLPWTTAYDWLRKLNQKGLVLKWHSKNAIGQVGRPAVYWSIFKNDVNDRKI